MKIILTGASGFIGSNLLHHFSKNHKVMTLSIRNEMEIDKIEKNIIDFKPDVFINCSWWGGNSYSDSNSGKQFDNIGQGIKIFEILNKLQSLYFVGFGSFSEYGDQKQIISETLKEQPVSSYGLSKNLFKSFSKYACDINKFRWLWVRPCYIYGPSDINSRLIPKVVNNCLKGNSMTLNSCKSVVDYLYIDDFVSAISGLIGESKEGVFNICSGKQYSVKSVIEKIKCLCGSEVNIVFDHTKDRDDFPNYICGNNKKLLNSIRWKPQYNIEQGLLETIRHYKNTLYLDEHQSASILDTSVSR